LMNVWNQEGILIPENLWTVIVKKCIVFSPVLIFKMHRSQSTGHSPTLSNISPVIPRDVICTPRLLAGQQHLDPGAPLLRQTRSYGVVVGLSCCSLCLAVQSGGVLGQSTPTGRRGGGQGPGAGAWLRNRRTRGYPESKMVVDWRKRFAPPAQLF